MLRTQSSDVAIIGGGLFGLSGKFELAQLLGSITKIDAHKIHQLQNITVAEWLEQTIRHPQVRALVQTLFRLATYSNDPHHQSAGAALAQLQLAVADNVWYVDDGWQTLVGGLRDTAQNTGVQIVSEAKIAGIDCGSAVHGVCLADGSRHAATSVVIAAGPHDAADLLPPEKSPCLHEWAAQAKPVYAACLDVGLPRLPRPKASFALGIDQPLYFSVHSPFATLGPEDGAMIHVAKYINPSKETDSYQDEHELEGLLDLMQPGWRESTLERRFLPHMMVTNAQVTAATGGTAGRPRPAVPDSARLYVAGDWVGPEGMLADASLASAKHAAESIVQDTYSPAEAA
jgi:phytoene dehydrogenase-like protein